MEVIFFLSSWTKAQSRDLDELEKNKKTEDLPFCIPDYLY
jgi:hypothetical protein